MSLLKGRAKKFDGTAIDYVSIFNWSDGKCIGQATPDASGNWRYYYHADTQVGITYVADGCEPITHGAYTVERNGDINPDWYVVNSPFDTDMIDLTGKVWVAHGNANVNNGALRLDGNGDYLTTPYSEDYHFLNSEDVTIRFNCNITSLDTSLVVLLTTRYDAPRPRGWCIFATDTGGMRLAIWDGSGTDVFSKTWDGVFSAGTEFELSLERKAMTWRLYVNGNQIGSSAIQERNYLVLNSNNLVIGSEAGRGDVITTKRELNGAMRNVQILKGAALGSGGATTPLIE